MNDKQTFHDILTGLLKQAAGPSPAEFIDEWKVAKDSRVQALDPKQIPFFDISAETAARAFQFKPRPSAKYSGLPKASVLKKPKANNTVTPLGPEAAIQVGKFSLDGQMALRILKLNSESTVTLTDIKRAYRRLAKASHPDTLQSHNTGSKEGHDRGQDHGAEFFMAVHKAYKILQCEIQRLEAKLAA